MLGIGGSGGHAPPGNFWNFRRSEIDSGAFWDTCTSGKVHVHVQINYAAGIIVDFRMSSMACYATRVVRARAKPRPSLDRSRAPQCRMSTPSLACGDEIRDQGRSIVASALWLVAALALYFNEFLCHA